MSGKSLSSRQSAPVSAEKSCSTAQVLWAGFRFLLKGREKTFSANRLEAQVFARQRFAALLRHAFPGESDRAVARHWARRLNVSERTVLNWLALTHSASIEDLFVVGATYNIWVTTAVLVGERTRDEVLAQIAGRS